METILKKQNRLPSPIACGILYSVVAVNYVYASKVLRVFTFNDIANLIISEIMFYAIPPIFLALLRSYDIKKTFRLKAPRPLEVLIMVLMSPVVVMAGFCAGFIALMAVKSIFGRVYLAGGVANYMDKGLLVSLLLVAVLPAVCEEILFRGMIQKGVESLGAGWSIFMSGLLFGLFHFDFQRLAAQTLIGMIAAYAVYRTGSIFNGIILHFMNNGLLTLLSDYSEKLAPGAGTQVVTDPFTTTGFLELAEQYNMSINELLKTMSTAFAVFLLLSILAILAFLMILKSITRTTVEKPEKVKSSWKGLLLGVPGLTLIIIVYVSNALTLLNNEIGLEILQIFGIA